MPQKDPSRTERATPKRLRKARNEGNVHKSQELTKTVALLISVIMLFFWVNVISRGTESLLRHFLSTAILDFDPTPASVMNMFVWLSLETAKMILPVMLVIGLATFGILRFQVGSLWTTKVFKPKLSKFNPIPGIKRMFFSLGTLTRLAKSLALALVIGIAPWLVIRTESENFLSLYYADAGELASYILHIGWKMFLYALVPMVIISLIDYFYTRWDYGENLKMTKAEVKDEHRQQEGDPMVKSKQRQKMMQMGMRRMMQQVPKADVVITNPTHIAVALSYDSMEAPAPVVVAKGADKIAEKIKEVARENKVPIRENKPLARTLYKEVEIGDMIPEDVYQAVAAILAQVWKTRPRKQARTTVRPPGSQQTKAQRR